MWLKWMVCSMFLMLMALPVTSSANQPTGTNNVAATKCKGCFARVIPASFAGCHPIRMIRFLRMSRKPVASSVRRFLLHRSSREKMNISLIWIKQPYSVSAVVMSFRTHAVYQAIRGVSIASLVSLH